MATRPFSSRPDRIGSNRRRLIHSSAHLSHQSSSPILPQASGTPWWTTWARRPTPTTPCATAWRPRPTPIGTLTYGYDFNGNVTSIQSSTRLKWTLVTYQYDALNREALPCYRRPPQPESSVTTNSYYAVGKSGRLPLSEWCGQFLQLQYNESDDQHVGQYREWDVGILRLHDGLANGGCSCSAETDITAVSEVIGLDQS